MLMTAIDRRTEQTSSLPQRLNKRPLMVAVWELLWVVEGLAVALEELGSVVELEWAPALVVLALVRVIVLKCTDRLLSHTIAQRMYKHQLQQCSLSTKRNTDLVVTSSSMRAHHRPTATCHSPPAQPSTDLEEWVLLVEEETAPAWVPTLATVLVLV
jgi:hypothetical protein